MLRDLFLVRFAVVLLSVPIMRCGSTEVRSVGARSGSGGEMETFAEGGLDKAVNGAIGELDSGLPLSAPLGLKEVPPSAGNLFGSSLAISGDIMVVGAPWYGDGLQAGGAFVYVRNGGGWEQQARLESTNTHVSTSFGTSVAVSGETVVVGAPREGLIDSDAEGNRVYTQDPRYSGAVYVFTRSPNNKWDRQVRLEPGTALEGQAFGKSVGISGDTLVAGMDATVGGQTNAGAVHLFTRTGTDWTQQEPLTPANPVFFSYFGNSVGIDGDTVVAGASREGAGVVYLFNRIGTAWMRQAELRPDGVPYPYTFGYSVGISGDTVIVGAPDEGVAAFTPEGNPRPVSSAGAGYIFVRTGVDWTLQTRLLASNLDIEDNFGFSVAIDGDVAVIGAIEESSNAKGVNGDQTNNSMRRAGAAYALTRSGSNWTAQAYLKARIPHAEDLFGNSVGVSGGTVAVGAPLEDSGGYDAAGNEVAERSTNSGIVYVFDAPVPTPLPEINVISGDNLSNGDSADLGEVAVGAVSRARSFAVGNTGQASLTGLEFVITGSNSSEFTLDFSPASTIAPSGNLMVEVHFTPGGVGPREALLQCFSNDGDESPFTIRLTGTGTSSAPLTRALTAYLKAANKGSGDSFGASVAVFGNTVVVGAPYESSNASGVNGNAMNDGTSLSGAAYIFTLQNGGWIQEAYLKSSNSRERDQFGTAVAIYADTVVVGAPRKSDPLYDSGAAFVFVRNENGWTQQAYLTADNAGFFDQFGTSVAISGNTLVVGAVGEGSGPPGTSVSEDDPTYAGSGAAYVFNRTNGVWTQQAMLKADNADKQHQLGVSVAISGDTVIAGAPYEGGGGGFTEGAAYVYTRTGTQWTQQSRLKMGSSAFNPRFGWSVGLDGELAVIGAPDLVQRGAAFVFRRREGTWSAPSQLLSPNSTSFQEFGNAVAVSGEFILVGARLEDSRATGIDGTPNVSARDSGAAYLFVSQSGNWVPQHFIKAGNTEEFDWFGAALAMHGSTIISGAPHEDGGALNGNGADNSSPEAGAAYLYTVLAPPAILLTGNGVQIGNAATIPSLEDHTDFGATAFTGATVRRSFTLMNTGMVDLIPGSIVPGGVHGTDFQILASSPRAVRPGEAMVLDVVFDPSAPGLREAFVTFTSNSAAASPFTFAIQGTGLNTPPQAAPQNVTLAEDTSHAITLAGEDPDPQPLAFRVSQPPAHGRLEGTGPGLVYIPDLDYFGPDRFGFVVNDGLEDSAPSLVSLEITPVNDPPVVKSQPEGRIQIRPGLLTELDLTEYFGDLETAAADLTYTLIQAVPPGFYRTTLADFRFTIEGVAGGSGLITVRAADSGGLFVESTFRLTVKHLPELISPIPDQKVFIGQSLNLEAGAFFTDADADGLFFSTVAGTPSSAASAIFNGSRLMLTALTPGTTEVILQAMDRDGNVITDTFTIFSVTEFPTLTAGPLKLDRQTGLYVQSLQVLNTTGAPSDGFRVSVDKLPAGVTLYNSAAPPGASGAWIDYRALTAPGAEVTLTLTYHVPGRLIDFSPLLVVEPLPSSSPAAGTSTPIGLQRLLRLADGSMMLEFSSIAGRIYEVQYSDDLTTWRTSPADVRAGANRVQWIDRGPPDTHLLPGLTSARYYRVRDISPTPR